MSGCATGEPADAGIVGGDAQRPPTTIVDAAWLDDVVLPEPLGPLPRHAPAYLGGLETHDPCARCHRNVSGEPAMRDERGRAIGADDLWRASMMGLAGRDPYWLAVLSHELAENPAAPQLVEHLCTRCHAPSANVVRGGASPVPFATVTSEASPLGNLARDGVTCTLCHRIADEGLGARDSFTGGFTIEMRSEIYGPHERPEATGMVAATGYTPVHAPHFMRSAICGTCHTVITRALDATGAQVGPPFAEQAPYLEWRSSAYSDEGPRPGPEARGCPSCHVPTASQDGVTLRTAISSSPPELAARSPYGRHVFVGGNAYMLELMAGELDWLGADVTPAALMAASEATEANLREAATIALDARVDGERIVASVRIENLTGHRLPTGYPSRRLFVRFTVEDGTGAVLWQSGRTHAGGGLTDRDGDRLDHPGAYAPHFDLITREDQVQVYESVMADLAGRPTRSLLRAASFLKDNRLLPRGWDPSDEDAAFIAPAGVDGDASFAPGGDTVRYAVPRPAGAARVRAELVYQTVPPAAVEHLFDLPTPAIARFDAMRRARPDRGRVLAAAERRLP